MSSIRIVGTPLELSSISVNRVQMSPRKCCENSLISMGIHQAVIELNFGDAAVLCAMDGSHSGGYPLLPFRT